MHKSGGLAAAVFGLLLLGESTSAASASAAYPPLLDPRDSYSALGRSPAMEAIAPERRQIGAAARLLPCIPITWTAEAGPSLRAGGAGQGRGWRSGSAADAAGLERLGFCIAGLKQSSASRCEMTAAVALR